MRRIPAASIADDSSDSSRRYIRRPLPPPPPLHGNDVTGHGDPIGDRSGSGVGDVGTLAARRDVAERPDELLAR